MAYTTKDQICAAALSILGEPTATPFTVTTGSVRDLTCQLHYPAALEHCLAYHRWDFATKISVLTLTATQPSQAPADFPFAYNIPSDMLRFHEIILTDGTKLESFKRIGIYIFLDANSYAGKVIYTLNDILPSLMPGTFADCLVYELAKRMAPILCQSPQLMEQMAGNHAQTFTRAITAETRQTLSNENNSPLAQAQASSLYQARFRR